MPVPILFIGAAAVTAALGVGKTVKAGADQKEANETNKESQALVDTANEKANRYRKQSSDAITNLGETKIQILDDSIKPFVSAFEKLHNVELTDSTGLNELQRFRIDKQSLGRLKDLQTIATSIAGGVASGAALGAVTAFGAYGAVMTFGAASTGTAIASLSGIAATNATLAFLGGGSLAAGGLGVAGGTMVLGGLVAGPALAVMGFIVGAKAHANKDRAYSNLAKAHQFEEEVETLRVVCRGIRMRANMFERLLLKLNALFEPLIFSLEEIIATSGTDYSVYTPEQKKVVATSMSVAGAIKAVLDTSILTEDGTLTPESETVAGSIQGFLSAANA